MTQLTEIFQYSKVILAEGAIVERLKSEFNLTPDPFVNFGGTIYSNPEIIKNIYRQYMDIGQKSNLPIMLMTSTRRSHEESIGKSKYKDKSILADNCRFLNEIRETYGEYSKQILLGGIIGCKGDAYNPKKALRQEEAYNYHRKQSHQFERQPIDFLFAAIMPEINECIGMARAMAETRIPYIISFMIRKDGCLLDGTFIADAIHKIDKQVDPKPFTYMSNCIHPLNLISALNQDVNKDRKELNRFVGLQANASKLNPEELDNSTELHQSDFNEMVNDMLKLHQDFGMKILGGCCGTNEKFIDKLANQICTKGL